MRPKPKIPFLFVPRSFFAPNPHGNACYAAHGVAYGKWSRIYPQGFLPRRRPNTSTSWDRMYYTQFLSYDIRGFSQRPHEKWGESNIRLKPKIPVLVVPRSFFAPNPHGNACYATYGVAYGKWSRIYPQGFLPRRRPNTSTSWDRMYYTQFLSYTIFVASCCEIHTTNMEMNICLNWLLTRGWKQWNTLNRL